MKKITIIGGGIAGLSLGNALLRRGVEVCLHEKRRYPSHRVCGEFLSGVPAQTLECLGLRSHLSGAAEVAEVYWYIGDKRILRTGIDPAAYGISRHRLDHSLAEEFMALGGRLMVSSNIDTRGLADEGNVLTTGKPSNRGGSWIGLSIHLRESDVRCLEMHSGPGGYIGLSPVEDGITNVTGLFKRDSNIRGKGIELMGAYLRHNSLGGLASRLGSWQPVCGSFCAISGFEFGEYRDARGFCIGDASRLIPPFVGNGMSMALESANEALDPLIRYCESKVSWEQAKAIFRVGSERIFKTRMRVAMFLHPLLFSAFGLGSIALGSRAKLVPVNTLFKLTR